MDLERIDMDDDGDIDRSDITRTGCTDMDDDGDLVDGIVDDIVESSVRSFLSQLKAVYQRELRKALHTTIRQTRRQPITTAWSRPTARAPSELRPVAPSAPASARVPAKKAQPLRMAGAALEAALEVIATPGQVTAPSKDAPKFSPTAEGRSGRSSSSSIRSGLRHASDGYRADEVENYLPGKTVMDIGDADAGSGAVPTMSEPASHSPISTPSPTPRRTGWTNTRQFSLLLEEEVEIIKRINKSEREKLKIAEANCHPDWAFHQKKEHATTASKKRAFDIVTSHSFGYFMGVVILLNSISIGVETSHTVHGDDVPLSMIAIEYLFLFIYVVELSLRFHAVGVKESLVSNWVKFDTVLVVAGVVSSLLTMFSTGGRATEVMPGNVTLLRLLRLVRLARTVRVVIQFRTLWLLVQGLLHAILPMVWTCIIMMMVVYVFAVLGMEIVVGSSDDALSLKAQEHFHSMDSSILTFMQMMTLDSSAPIYRPLIEANGFLSVLFLAFYMVGPIALMSIITAVMVESSIRIANMDQEAKQTWETDRKRAMMPKLKKLLSTLDADGSGDVVLEELLGAPRELQDQITHICDMPTLALQEVFHMLDVDRSGTLDIEEFVHGIIHTQQPDKPSELLLLVQMSKAILNVLNDISVSSGCQIDRVSVDPFASLYRMTLMGV